MTMNGLRRKIKKKFGSYHNFARIVGVETLRGKTPMEIDRIASKLTKSGAGGVIPRHKLEALKSKISGLPEGITEFCQKEGFSEVSVYQIIQGRRKRMSPVVERLFKHFGI
jgi:hypothetical protein